MKRWFTALVAAAGMAGAGVAAAAPAAAAANPGCHVVDTNSDHTYPSLHDAVTAASTTDAAH
jgi:hypothetical protein